MNPAKGGSDPPNSRFKTEVRGNNLYQIVVRDEVVSDILDDGNMSDISDVLDQPVEINDDVNSIKSNEKQSEEMNSIEANISKGINSETEKQTEKNSYDLEYNYKSFGPFEVYVESKENDRNIGNYHNLAIAKLIYEEKFKGLKTINRKGKNRVGVEFGSYTDANSFLHVFKEKQNFNVYIPKHRVSCKGIIRNVDLDLNDKVALKIINVRLPDCKLLEVRRFNRRAIDKEGKQCFLPTGTLCLTFSGINMPREVDIFGLNFQVSPFVGPVIQCYNCLLYGHTKKLCRAKTKCFGCGQQEHGKDKVCVSKCYHCDSQEHLSTSKLCPEYKRQVTIKQVMSLDNKSFFEAAKEVPEIPNKSIKKRVSQFPVFNSGDFPSLSQSTQVPKSISVAERRDVYQSLNPRASYSSAVATRNINPPTTSNNIINIKSSNARDNNGTSKKRRSDYNSQSNFNWEEHNEQLFYPDGRFPSSSTPKVFAFRAPLQESQESLDMYSPNQRENINQQTFNDVVSIVASLPLQARLEVLNFMTRFANYPKNDSISYRDEPSASKQFKNSTMECSGSNQ